MIIGFELVWGLDWSRNAWLSWRFGRLIVEYKIWNEFWRLEEG
jgi:hypothetical protein